MSWRLPAVSLTNREKTAKADNSDVKMESETKPKMIYSKGGKF